MLGGIWSIDICSFSRRAAIHSIRATLVSSEVPRPQATWSGVSPLISIIPISAPFSSSIFRATLGSGLASKPHAEGIGSWGWHEGRCCSHPPFLRDELRHRLHVSAVEGLEQLPSFAISASRSAITLTRNLGAILEIGGSPEKSSSAATACSF